MRWQSKPLLDSGIITKARHPGSMAHAHLPARRRLLAAPPPLVHKVLLEADRFQASGRPPRCYVIGSHSIFSRISSATGTNHIGRAPPSTWIPYRIFGSCSTSLNLGLRQQHDEKRHADGGDLPPEPQKQTMPPAVSFNRSHLVHLRSELTVYTSLTGKLLTSSMFPFYKPLEVLLIKGLFKSTNTPIKAQRAE